MTQPSLMETTRKNNVKFNSKNLQFKNNKVYFYVHARTEYGQSLAKDCNQDGGDIESPILNTPPGHLSLL